MSMYSGGSFSSPTATDSSERSCGKRKSEELELFSKRLHYELSTLPSVQRKERYCEAMRMWLLDHREGEEEDLLQHLSTAVDGVRKFVVVDERTRTEKFYVPPSEKAVSTWRTVDSSMRRMKRKWDKVVDARLALQRAQAKWTDSVREMEMAVELLGERRPTFAEGYAEGHLYSSSMM